MIVKRNTAQILVGISVVWIISQSLLDTFNLLFALLEIAVSSILDDFELSLHLCLFDWQE